MKINRIKLYNISSYVGTSEFDFTVSERNNIVLIGGQNGTGKTSLFTAIKLALYGPLCFQYQSKNNQYTARIRELINHDAFSQTEVNAFIELDIELPRERETIQYTIRREWSYEDKKLSERDFVWEHGKTLNEQEINFFQNYLYHVIPPNLFDFFFFDGEEIANFFSTPSYHSYLREAVLTLEHYDTFRLIERYCRRYMIGEDESNIAIQQRNEYESICNELDEAEEVRQIRTLRIQELKDQCDKYDQEVLNLEESFKKQGGLPQSELEELHKQINTLERRRDQINTFMKGFVEDTVPLILTMPVAKALRVQLSIERKVQQYQLIAQQISVERLGAVLSDILPSFGVDRPTEFIQILAKTIDDSVKPASDAENFVFLHDLSQEQQEVVGEVLRYLERFAPNAIVDQIQEKDAITLELSKLRKRLDDSLSPEEIQIHEMKIRHLGEAKERCNTELEMEKRQEDEYEKHLEKLEVRRKSLRTILIGSTRRIEAGEYTERLGEMMRDMLSTLLDRKRQEIEEKTLQLSKEILRKEHFIDLVELDEKFNFSLYRRQDYSFDELSSLFTHLGLEELARRIGMRGVLALLEYFHVDSISHLKKIFKKGKNQFTLYEEQTFRLYNRIEFQQLSKGEKQIFILSLYWAIIKTSGRDIPFVIDTPFARIDTEHREQIAKKFFPNISGQVIILSTDEEITSPYYQMLQPHIAHEYTLSFNEKIGGTEVETGYSFGGDQP